MQIAYRLEVPAIQTKPACAGFKTVRAGGHRLQRRDYEHRQVLLQKRDAPNFKFRDNTRVYLNVARHCSPKLCKLDTEAMVGNVGLQLLKLFGK